ncbi:MAG: YbdK family carboxylate-amine ligase [Gammaproteobacteria bacterium]
MDGSLQAEGLPAFRASRAGTLGIELELMLVDGASGQLASDSPALLAEFSGHPLQGQVKAEVTQSMIEVMSGVHASAESLECELRDICRAARAAAARRGLLLCGGGAHPFREWPQREIYPDARFDRLYETYGYLLKLFTVFGLHVHVGMPSADDAIRLAHVFNRHVPHLIALSASSPLQRGVDTGYESSRVNIVSMFPLSGHLPGVNDWRGFAAYFARMQATGLVRSMKDFYWDVRPKPETGTVEIRVCDTPLSVTTAADIAALCQAIARRCLAERPPPPGAGVYEAYAINRFRAARSAFDAEFFDAETGKSDALGNSVVALLDACLPHGEGGAAARLLRLRRRALACNSDARWIREALRGGSDWARLMEAQSDRLLGPGDQPVSSGRHGR